MALLHPTHSHFSVCVPVQASHHAHHIPAMSSIKVPLIVWPMDAHASVMWLAMCLSPAVASRCPEALLFADPEQHVSIDLWLLLLLIGLGAKRSEAMHKLLRKKFTEGHVDNTWLDKAVIGHQVCSLIAKHPCCCILPALRLTVSCCCKASVACWHCSPVLF